MYSMEDNHSTKHFNKRKEFESKRIVFFFLVSDYEQASDVDDVETVQQQSGESKNVNELLVVLERIRSFVN